MIDFFSYLLYIKSKDILLKSIKDDYSQTKKCKIQMSNQENYLNWGLTWGLPKHSPYARDLNNG